MKILYFAWRYAFFSTLLIGLCGCDMLLLSPPGRVAAEESWLMGVSTGVMLLVILPVMFCTVLFAWRYRQRSKRAHYAPDWHSSSRLEVSVWGISFCVIAVLGTLSWKYTHQLDPYRPLDKMSLGQQQHPLVVDVVAMDWKWLFLYPDYGVATVNELRAPVGVPIEFRLTSATVMNSFFIPALAGQIYAMAGMETRLNAIMDKPGEYRGFSANFSGKGFSHMNFSFLAMEQNAFTEWMEITKARYGLMDKDAYMQLAKPSMADKVKYFHLVDNNLFHWVVDKASVRDTSQRLIQQDHSAERVGLSGYYQEIN